MIVMKLFPYQMKVYIGLVLVKKSQAHKIQIQIVHLLPL